MSCRQASENETYEDPLPFLPPVYATGRPHRHMPRGATRVACPPTTRLSCDFQ